jgi:hypothetical protein
MSEQGKTGSVSAKGNIKAGNIITGIDLQGDASDAVVKAALETMQKLRAGDVRAGGNIELSGDIVAGLRFLNPQAPDRDSFLAELKALRAELAGLAAEPDTPAEVSGAAETLAETMAEAEKEQPLARKISGGLRTAVELLTDAGKVWDATSKAGPLLLKAIGTATVLYQAAQVLF